VSVRLQAEKALNKAHEGLELKVNERTKELTNTNLELVRIKEEAVLASKAKSEFLANMSHEIRTPMNAVMGFTSLLEETELSSKQSAYLSSIQAGAKGLMTIINDILDLSKIEAGKMKLEFDTVNLLSFINDIKQIFSEEIGEKNLDFEVILDTSLSKTVVFDETRVRQILFNLIGNAIKFTAKGFIRLHVRQHFAKKIGDSEELKKVSLSFDVVDSGVGIKADQQKLIFNSFTQTDGQSNRQFGGTGLGLTISMTLAKLMGGEIKLVSALSGQQSPRLKGGRRINIHSYSK